MNQFSSIWSVFLLWTTLQNVNIDVYCTQKIRWSKQAERVYKHCHQWHSTLHVLLNLMKHCKMKDQNLEENVDWLPITLRFHNEQGGKRVLPDCGWPLTVVKYRIHSLDTHTTQAFILCVVSEGDCLQLCCGDSISKVRPAFLSVWFN